MGNLKIPQLNRLIISGRLTRDPELKQVNDKPTCGFSLAVDSGFGEKRKTSFFNCRAWDKQAERIGALTKGAAIIVEGRMEEEKWESKGEEKRGWKVTVSMVHELEWADDGEREPRGSRPRYTPAHDDDIPF